MHGETMHGARIIRDRTIAALDAAADALQVHDER